MIVTWHKIILLLSDSDIRFNLIRISSPLWHFVPVKHVAFDSIEHLLVAYVNSADSTLCAWMVTGQAKSTEMLIFV